MIVMKFGGTSVGDVQALRRSARIVAERGGPAPVVVVSAISGATRALIGMGRAAAAGDTEVAQAALSELASRHLALVDAFPEVPSADEARARVRDLIDELEPLLRGIALLRDFEPAAQDALAGFGERLSTPIFVCALEAVGCPAGTLDVTRVMLTDDRFGNACPLENDLEAAVRDILVPLLAEGRPIVTQGYIGRTPGGRPTTMGFEASDFTATLLGAALKADEVQIWTDVSGMLTADPRIVADARPVPRLRYVDAAELALLGAKVLHPRSIGPVEEAGVPLRILNSSSPDEEGTLIDAAHRDDRSADITSVALLDGVTAIHVAPEVRNEALFLAVYDLVDRARRTVRLAVASPLGMTLVLDGGEPSPRLREQLATWGTVTVDASVVAVSIVGPGVGRSEVLAEALRALDGVDVRMTVQGASPHSLSLLVSESEGAPAVRQLHDRFFAARRAGAAS